MGPGSRIDGHIHFSHPMDPDALIRVMDRTGTAQANLVLVPSRQRLTSVPEALVAKAKYPGRFYVFTSLDVSEYFIHGKTVGKSMAKFVEKMRSAGCDGLKLIEGKPNFRKMFPLKPFDDPVWDPLWDYAERTQLPILWHVNDPETCWDPEKAPKHIRVAGELYDESFVNNEAQYLEMENIMTRHPRLKVCFAHLYFMSAQLPRLAALLDRFPNMMVDITPGLEIYVNLSSNPDAARTFFETYADRILYGTDIGSRCVLGRGALDERESLARVDLIDSLFDPATDRVLEEDGAYLVNTEPFRQRGFALSPETAEKLYGGNFRRFAGETPAPVHPRLVKIECRRIRTTLKIMSFMDKGLRPDYSVSKNVEAFFDKYKQ